MLANRPEKSVASFKTQKILQHLRGEIVNGRYLPGHRLPTFSEMENQFSVGRGVIQNALATLKQDGFVRSVDRQGLYVVSNPPHLHQYGFVFASAPGELGWTRLTNALTNEAHRLERHDPSVYFQFYYGMDHPETQQEAIQRLWNDIRSCRVAGLILTPKTFGLLKEPEFKELGVPVACLWLADEVQENITRVNVDATSMISRSLAYLKERGRHRVAILHMADTTSGIDHQKVYDAVGLKLHRPWVQHVGRSHPQFAENMVSLLMDYSPEIRPDGLIIADDSLVEFTARGLVNTDIKIGIECDVIAHTNWPWPAASPLPITRIGFDVRDIMRRAINGICDQVHGEKKPTHQIVPALFEWEVEGVGGTK